MFCSDYPRGPLIRLWLCCFPAPHPLPVAHALAVPLPFARRLLPVALLCLPPRPLPRRLPAALAAIPLARPPRRNARLASFQQTRPPPPPTGQSLSPPCLIFGLTCKTLERAHGR